MTKLLYTKQEIITGATIIARLVAEINLRDYRDRNYLTLDISEGFISITKVTTDEQINSTDYECLYLINLGEPGLIPADDLLTLEQVITKLTNFKWSNVNEK